MRERLLIVDDETGVVELLKSYFEMSGYPTAHHFQNEHCGLY